MAKDTWMADDVSTAVRKARLPGAVQVGDLLVDAAKDFEHAPEVSGKWQEIANALTMIPGIWYATMLVNNYGSVSPCTPELKSMLAGTWMQAPFSMMYHGACFASICGFPVEPHGYWRCLDQMFIHVFCMLAAWATSSSTMYTLAVACPFGIYAIVMLWFKSEIEPRHLRFIRMGMAKMLMWLPMVWRGDWYHLMGTLLSFSVGSAFFALSDSYFGGWGHAAFHCMGVPYSHFLFGSIMILKM